VIPPSADIAAFTYNTDAYKLGSTKARPPWNNGFKCNLETNDPLNKVLKHKFPIAPAGTTGKEKKELTADVCSSWCEE